jgi:hypothetical protein
MAATSRMSLDDLAEAAEALYGAGWQTPLARDLKVALRTVQRWAAGDVAPPDLRRELAALCRARSRQLAALAARLDVRET